MIRSALRAEISERVFDETNAIASAAVVNTWIDLAEKTLWKAYAWPFKSKSDDTLVTTLNVNTFVLPADVQEIKKLVNTDLGSPLRPRNERWLENFPTLTSISQPPRFYVDGGLTQAADQVSAPKRVLKLYPTPDAAYHMHLRYLKLIALRSAQATPDSAFGSLPEDFDEATIQWCLVRYNNKLSDPTAVLEARSEYKEELARLIATYSTLTESFPVIDSDEIDMGPYNSRSLF